MEGSAHAPTQTGCDLITFLMNVSISALHQGSSSSRPLLVSDQPYMAEDGFLPISPTSVRGEGEAAIIHSTDELHSRDNLQGSLEEEEELDGVMREAGSRGVRQKNESAGSDSTWLGEDGSGEGFSESEDEQVMRLRRVQKEVRPVVPEEENGREGDGTMKEDDEMTWYFWR